MKYELDPLPLTDRDFAQIRANVMAKVEERRPRLFIWKWAVAMLVMIVAGIVALPTRNAGLWPADPPASRPAPMPTCQPSFTSALLAEPPARAVVVKQRVTKPAPVEHPPEIRIEIRTPDPDVRIIWIANQSIKTEEESSL